MIRPDSIRARVTLGFTLAVSGLALLVGAGILGWTWSAADRRANRLLETTARRIRLDLEEKDGAVDPSELAREEGAALESADGAMLILDLQGRVIFRTRQQVPAWPGSSSEGWRVRA